MRLTADEVRAGLLHPEPIVRDAALAYFADSFSPDPTILSTVAQGVERYGLAAAFSYTSSFEQLAVSDEMAEWAVYQLSLPRVNKDLKISLMEPLHEADPGWIAARGPDVAAVDDLPWATRPATVGRSGPRRRWCVRVALDATLGTP